MGQLRQLAGQTVVYGASSVIGRVLNYLLVPLYTAVFDPAAYGVVTELYAYVAFLNILYTYGLETAYFRFATGSDEPKAYYQRAQSSVLITSLLFSVVLWLLADSIAEWLQYPGKGFYIECLALILAIDAIVAIPFARLRLEGKAIRFAIFKLSNIGVNIGLNLFFLVFVTWWIESFPESQLFANLPDWGVGYVFLSNLIANGLYLLFFIPYWLEFRLRLDNAWLKMLGYAAPLLIMGFAGVTNEMLSRALLKYWLPTGFYPGQSNQEILGIFGACYKIAVFMTLAVQAFKYAFEPFFFNKSKEENSPQLFANIMQGFVVFGCFAWMGLSFFLEDFAPLFLRQEAYLSGLAIVPWLLGGGLFLGIYFNLSIWYKVTDKTSYGAWITILGAIVTVIGNYLLIPIWGYMGSASVTFLSYLSMVIVSYSLGQKHYFIPYSAGKSLFYLIFSGVSILAFYFWPVYQPFKTVLAFGLLGIFALMVWLLDLRRLQIKHQS